MILFMQLLLDVRAVLDWPILRIADLKEIGTAAIFYLAAQYPLVSLGQNSIPPNFLLCFMKSNLKINPQ